MEFNRNHYFLVGLVVLLLGIQFRTFQSFELNEDATLLVSKHFRKPTLATDTQNFFAETLPPRRHTVRPPDWLGWALLSVGSVFILHSLAMRKPG